MVAYCMFWFFALVHSPVYEDYKCTTVWTFWKRGDYKNNNNRNLRNRSQSSEQDQNTQHVKDENCQLRWESASAKCRQICYFAATNGHTKVSFCCIATYASVQYTKNCGYTSPQIIRHHSFPASAWQLLGDVPISHSPIVPLSLTLAPRFMGSWSCGTIRL